MFRSLGRWSMFPRRRPVLFAVFVALLALGAYVLSSNPKGRMNGRAVENGSEAHAQHSSARDRSTSDGESESDNGLGEPVSVTMLGVLEREVEARRRAMAIRDVGFPRAIVVRSHLEWAKIIRKLYRDAGALVDIVVDHDSQKELFPLSREQWTVVGVMVKCVSKTENGHQECMTDAEYDALPPHVRVSALRGLAPDVRIGKDYFCETMMSAIDGFVPQRPVPAPGHEADASHDLADARSFFFPCYILPGERDKLRAAASASNGAWPFARGQAWLVKAADRHSGQGSFVVDSFNDLLEGERASSNAPGVAMPLLHPPLLIRSQKFDLRTYVLVTSVAPLRVYVHDVGIVLIAAEDYNVSASGRDIRPLQFLTNSEEKYDVRPIAELEWTFDQLREHFTSLGHDTAAFFHRLRSAIARVFLSYEAAMFRKEQRGGGPVLDNSRSYAVFGVDVIIDANMQPRVMEANANARMSRSTIADQLKIFMVRDALTLMYGEDVKDSDGRNCARKLHDRLTSLGVRVIEDEQGTCAGWKPPESMCVDAEDLRVLVRGSCERERCHASSSPPCLWRPAFPTADGEKYDEFVAHLARQHGGDVPHRSAWRLHWLETQVMRLEEKERQSQ